ncbi:MAG: hypothetical protein ACWGNV_03040 [Bacteroidales bacterium]
MEKAYRNTGYFMILLVPLVILGFCKSYFSQIPDFNEGITLFHHLHAAIATVWILALIAQPLLIRYRKYKIHKWIGKFSYALFPLLVLSFIPMIYRALHGANPVNAFYPIADCSLLILFYSLAVYNRKNMDRHMRYIIGAAIVFLGPTFGRIGPNILGLQEKISQNIQYVIIYSILIGLILLDRKHSKNIKPYSTILAGWVVHQFVFNVIF